MPRKSRWNKETLDELRAMAATGLAVSEICERLDISVESVVGAGYSHGIKINRHTAAEREEIRARTRVRDKVKKQNKRLREVEARHKAVGLPAVSRTSPAYRNQLPGIGDRTKTELRAMLAEAARNTAEMSV